MPGSQFVVLNMDESCDDAFLVPYVLQVELVGTAGEGAPECIEGAAPPPRA